MVLDSINLPIKKSSITGIYGKVGAGKTTLLLAMLKELNTRTGNIEMPQRKSYFSQDYWLFNGNVLENILFGDKLDTKRYKKVLWACSLEEVISLIGTSQSFE